MKKRALKLALAQLNFTVGDIAGNCAMIHDAAVTARDDLGCDLVIFPELAVTGYPPEDLLLRADFLERVSRAVGELRNAVEGIALLYGYPSYRQGNTYNSAEFVYNGEVLGVYDKQLLPNYSVFDEKRYFVAGERSCVVQFNDRRIGLTICEDIWGPEPTRNVVAQGADMIVNINASPFHINRLAERFAVVSERARENRVPVVYLNLVGGQDELVFDGASFVVDSAGEVTQCAASFSEELIEVEFEQDLSPRSAAIAPSLTIEQSVYSALVTGVRDYVNKNGFPGAIVGLSGGIDSALTLAIASDALGPDRVTAVMMPSRYSADISLQDAQAEVAALGVAHHVISIEPPFTALLQQLEPLFAGLPADETEENLQARSRGVLLMAISNKSGAIVLTTGNKSEMAVGYATLYGDMAGGFAVIKDVFKTLVYRLARYRNDISPVIPKRVLTRPPTAELAPDQRDSDSLPPYEVLDPVLECYVERDQSPREIVAQGYDPEIVARVIGMVDRNEYKRRQAPPGVRITRRAFGRDRRYPITSRFKAGT